MLNKKLEKTELHDVHQEYAEINVLGGVGNLIHIHKGKGWMLPIKYAILVPTQNQRGVHMSRLVAAIQNNSESERIEYSMRDICKEVNGTQPGCRIICEIEYSYKDQFIPITIEMREKGNISYTFRRTGITACPCSKVMVGIGHMQRAELTLTMVSSDLQDFDNVAEKMGACFSSVPKEHLKREDEGEKIQEAQSNAKFAEDVVRECLSKFSAATLIKVRSFESIHIHDAIAYWSKQENDDI
ncbi:MAG TPA: GTP cyclohydrolase, FolE2/MptA family [Nitrososphaerales archaeon]|nr:GTP cyclohydrolase, FolE2/MptA family [Nitrososphaerales archaeon]